MLNKKVQKIAAVLVIFGFIGSTYGVALSEARPRPDQRHQVQRPAHNKNDRHYNKPKPHYNNAHKPKYYPPKKKKKNNNNNDKLIAGLVVGAVVGTVIANNR